MNNRVPIYDKWLKNVYVKVSIIYIYIWYYYYIYMIIIEKNFEYLAK